MKCDYSMGTSSERGYTTVRSGWLNPPDPFLGPDAVRGWPRGGSAEQPSTLMTLSGLELVSSWDRCALALRSIAELRLENPHGSWVDCFSSDRLSRLLGSADAGERNDSRANYLAWVAKHILGPWRLREAMRLYRGWSLAEARLDPEPGCQRAPEAVIEAAAAGECLRIDRYGAALRGVEQEP